MYADEEDDDSYFDYEGEGFPSLATRNSGYGGTTRIIPKVPPTFDGTTSWLEYEDMIEDWLGITNLSPEKWGPSLKNALVGQAEFYKNMLDNQKLRDENNGVAHFKETLRPYFVKGVSYIFMWRFMYLFRCWRTNAMDFITWITRFEVAVRRLQTSWVDLTPLPPETLNTVFIRDYFTTQQQEHLTQLIHNGASEDEQLTFVRNIREQIVTDRRERQKANFPLGDNLVSLIFLVQADLNESQRKRFISAMNLRDVSMMDYTYLSVKQLFMELFCSTGTSVADPMMRRTQRRNFLVLDEGSLDGEDVLWVQDEETGEEGFMTLYAEDEFWVLQSNRSGGFTYRRTRVPGRQFRKPSKGFRKGKGGSGKGKGKSRPGFQSRRGRSNMTQDANSMYGKGKKGKKGGKSKGKGKGQKGKGKKGDDMPSANEASSLRSHRPLLSLLGVLMHGIPGRMIGMITLTTQRMRGGQRPRRTTVTPTWQLDYQCQFLQDWTIH